MTNMTEVPEQTIQDFLGACHDIATRRLVRCSSGNLSMRLDAERLLITTSRSWMETASADDACVCRIADGTLVAGNAPSVEVGFHAGILRTRPHVNVVLHFQTPCATALASRDTQDVNYFVIPEIPYYIGPIARIDYRDPGSEELARAVTEAMLRHDMVTIANHGQVAAAADFTQAIQNAEFFELACEIIVHGRETLKPLTVEYVQRLLDLRQSASATTV